MKTSFQHPYTVISKFGRINLKRDIMQDSSNVDEVLNDIKEITTGSNKNPNQTRNDILIGQHLLSSNAKQFHTRFRQTKRPKRKPPPAPTRTYSHGTVVKVAEKIPGTGQYTPNYEVTLPQAPQYVFPHADSKEKTCSADSLTQSEMMRLWEHGIRLVSFVESSQDPPDVISKTDIEQSKKQALSEKTPGIISRKYTRDSYLPPADVPGPGSYVINRSLDKPRVISFKSQSIRPPVTTLPDRPHCHLASALDATKPRIVTGIIPFDKQTSREKNTVKENNIWDEIEAEQKALLSVIKPTSEIQQQKEKKVEPFSKQTTYFDKSPFSHLIHSEGPLDVNYEVEAAKKTLEQSRKILPGTNFGRRLDDNDRAIYAKSEAPDTLYSIMDQWKASCAPVSVPIFDNMVERKSAYDYMPKACGGNYQTPPNVWAKPAPKISQTQKQMIDKRKYLIEAPPDYHEKRVSSELASHFTWE